MDGRSCADYTVILLLCFLKFSGGQSCIYDPDSDRLFTHTGTNVMRGRQVIIPSFMFNCYGRINHVSCFAINASHPGDDEPIIQLWRPSSSGSNVYNIIGQTEFLKNENPISDTQFYYIDAPFTIHQIKFQPGDVIGYYQPSNPRHLLWSISETGYVSYSINASATATTINTSNVDYTDDGLVPVVRVDFDIQCDNLSIPANGDISCSSGRVGVGYERDTCNFTCDNGYQLTGSHTRTCQGNGRWNGTDTMCKRVCPFLANITYGYMNCSLRDDEVPTYGDTCSFTCITGYELTGNSDIRTCESDGRWSGTDINCTKSASCCTHPDIQLTVECVNSSAHLQWKLEERPSFGFRVTYECNSNASCNGGTKISLKSSQILYNGDDTYAKDITIPNYASCWFFVENLDYSHDQDTGCSAIVTCSTGPCPTLDDLSNGMINCSPNENQEHIYEYICHFACNTGYKLIGSDTRICQSNESWSGNEAKCQRVSCLAPNNLDNGMSNCSEGQEYFYGQACHFTCNTGYNLTGSDIRICQSDGSWSRSETKCERVHCLAPKDFENGVTNCSEDQNYFYEDICYVMCDTGYELIGSNIKMCLSDGNWSVSETKCQKGLPDNTNGGSAIEESVGDSGSGSSAAAIGGAIGALIFIIAIIIIVLIIILCRRRAQKKKAPPPNSRMLPNGMNTLHNPLYGQFMEFEEHFATKGTIRSDYEDPDTPDYLAMAAATKTAQCELSASPAAKGASPSLPEMNKSTRAVQNEYTTPYKDDGDYGPLYCVPSFDEQKIYEEFEGKMFRKLQHDEIMSLEELGMGEFGVVTRGKWKQSTGQEVQVAVKTLNDNASAQDRVRFLQEAAIMCQFNHPNVIKLYGVVTEAPIMIVLEYMSHGSLRNFLMQMRHANSTTARERMPHTLLKFCSEIAAGMVYLSGKQFVHRDLAARNILISEYFACKIADFGMSRDLIDHNYYITSGGKIPVKWTAPEALHFRKYSVQSDVWSYGCVLYEIWSLGHKPFEELTNTEALEKVDRGYRLPPPLGCPRAIYKMMIDCWNPDPNSRPQFGQIAEVLAGDGECLLAWSDEDKQIGGENVMKLGALSENGNNLYYDLQLQYKQ